MSIQRVLKWFYHSIFELRNKYILKKIYKAEMRNINKKEFLWSRIELSNEEENCIKTYWKEISGQDISTKWHRLYQSYMGKFNIAYFPEILYSTKLEKKLSSPKYYGILSDKGFLNTIFPGDQYYRNPVTYIWNCDSVYTDSNKNIVPESAVFSIMKNIGNAVIKPTRDTSSGEGVRILDIHNGIDNRTGDRIEDIIKEYRCNYIVQECVIQSEVLSKIYAKSLNTFRVITFITPDGIHHAPIGMRMGRGNAEIDNIHAGGLTIGINKEYQLREFAFSEMGDKYLKHPDTGILFKGYSIEALKNIVAQAERLHGSMPQIKMISWDWSLDINNVPVLIEINISGQSVWFPQMLNGEGVFGEYTEYFASLIKESKYL